MEKIVRKEAWRFRRYPAYIGLDVHKDTIAVSAADGMLSGEPQYMGEVASNPESVRSAVRRLEEIYSGGLLFCYEADPCEYVP